MDDRPSDAAPGGPPGGATAATLEGTRWRLTAYPGPAGDTVPVPDGVVATAQFADGRVFGVSGCNRYTGAYSVDGDALTVSDVATTMMACEPERMALEQAFTTALAGTVGYAIADDILQLTAADGAPVLLLAAAPAPSLTGTEWVAIGINNGRGGVVSVAEGATVTAIFGADGTVSGSGGCNRYTGSYTSEGARLAVGPVAATRRACLDAGVMEQESQYFAALERVATFAFDGDRLQLRDAGGALQVDYRAAEGP